MAEPFDFFENSPFGDFSATASGSSSGFPSGLDLPDLLGYFIGLVDKKKLLEDLVDAYKNRLTYFNYDFKRYQLPFPDLITLDLTASSNVGKYKGEYLFLNSVEVQNNTKNWKIEVYPAIGITPHPNELYAEYTINLIYTDDVPESNWDRFLEVASEVDFAGLTVGLLKRVEAIQFTTRNFWAFDKLVNRFPIDYQRTLFKVFDNAFGQVAKDDFYTKRNLYWQAPRVYLETFSLEDLYKDFVGLLEYDREWFHESNNTMVKVLEVIASKDKGIEFIYDKFNGDPWRLKTLYDNMDGESVRGGQSYSNKTILASLMIAFCNYKNQGLNESRKKRDIIFRIDDTHRVDSNVAFDDTYEDKFDLRQEILIDVPFEGYQGRRSSYPDWIDDPSKYQHYLHPLDIVTLIVQDKNGHDVEMFVPAIFVKDMAYVAEWAKISKAIRVGIDILIIVLSAVTLVAGAGFLFTTLAIVDLGIATGDLTIQAFEKEIRKLEGGDKFLDAWEKVYFVAGVVTGVAALPSLIQSGIRLFLKISEAGVLNQLKGMIKYALGKIESFPKFVNNKFEIITNFASLSKGDFLLNMNRLTDEGVMILQGVLSGERESKLFLNYKGVNLVGGTLSDLKKFIRGIFKNGDDGMKNYLRKAFSDPTFSIYGAGVKSHPKEWKAIIQELETAGVEFRIPDNTLAYGPHPSGGKPGVLVLTEDASITALMHEAKHFKDDLAAGFPGMKGMLQDGTKRWKLEFDAYMVEVNFLRKEGKFDAANELLANAKNEKRYLEELYNIKL